MATESNNIFMNTFIKGMNSDVAVDVIGNQQYTFAQNYRIQTQTGIHSEQTVNDGNGAVVPIDKGKRFSVPFLTDNQGILAAGSINDNGVIILKDSKVDDEYTWVIYRVTRTDDTIRYTRVFGIYDDNGIEKHVAGAITKASKFSITLDQPQSDILNLYIADGVHHIMIINVLDEAFGQVRDIQQVESNATYPKEQPKIKALISGSMKASQVIYQYRFYKKFGIVSTLSPETKSLQIIAQNRLSEKGCAEDTVAQVGVRLQLPSPQEVNSMFDHIQVFRIQQIKKDDVKVFLIADRKVNADVQIIVDDLGAASELQEYSLDEYNALTSLHIIPTCIESAQNRLFCANITDKTVIQEDTIKAHTYSLNSDYTTITLADDLGYERTAQSYQDVEWMQNAGYYKNIHRGVNDDYSNDGSVFPGEHIVGGKSDNVEWKLVYTKILLDEQEDLLESSPAKATTSDISTSIMYSDGTVCCTQQDYYDTILNSTIVQDATYNYSFASSYLRSLRRGETYRYGVILYTDRGERTSTLWIDDIKVPSEQEIPSTVFENGKLYAQPIGIQFNVTVPEDSPYTSYQIVRCAKIPEYTRDLYQMVINPTIHNNIPDTTLRMSPWYPMPFLMTNPMQLGTYYFITNAGSAGGDRSPANTNPHDVVGEGRYVHTLMSEDINIHRSSTQTTLSSDNYVIHPILNRVVGACSAFSEKISVDTTSNPTIVAALFNDFITTNEFRQELLRYVNSEISITHSGIRHELKHWGNGSIPFQIPWVGKSSGVSQGDYTIVYTGEMDISTYNTFLSFLTSVKNGIDDNSYTISSEDLSTFNRIYIVLSDWLTIVTGANETLKPENDHYTLSWAKMNNLQTRLTSIMKGINGFASKTLDSFQFSYYNVGNNSFQDFESTGFGDTKQPGWNDGFDNIKNDGTYIRTFSKKYQQFDTSINNIRYVNWFAGFKYDLGGKDRQYGVNKIWGVDGDEEYDENGKGDRSFAPGSLTHLGNDACQEFVTSDKFRPVTAYGWIGPGPVSLITTSNLNTTTWLNTSAPTEIGCFVCGIRHSATQFSGDTKTMRQYDTYYGHGSYCATGESQIVFDGEIYIAPAEIISLYKAYNFESSLDTLESMQVVNYVPMESVINPYFEYGLNYRNTQSKNVMVEPGEVVGVTTQDRPAYTYNDVYSQNDTTSFYYENESDEKQYNQYTSRIMYSEQQAAADSVNVKGVFKPLNYIDAESKYGPITHLLASKDTLYVWQTNAFAKLSINERSLVKDENSNMIQLGQGGVLQRTDYLSQTNGMRESDHAAVGVDDQIYWLDMIHNSVMWYGGQVKNLSTELAVQNYLNQSIDHENQVWLSYDVQHKELLCKCILNGNQLVFNVSGPYAIGVFTRDFVATLYLTGVLYGICDGALTQYTNLDRNETRGFLKPTVLEFSVNGVPTTTKTFDNQQINVLQKSTYFGLDLNFMVNKTFGFETDLHNNFETEMMHGQRISAREGNIQYAIPRADNEDYGNRMRGKWMKVTMTDTNPEYDYAISHIITKFRQSFS